MTLLRRTLPFALGFAVISVVAGPVAAQDTTQVRRDSLQRDSTARATVVTRDSTAVDSTVRRKVRVIVPIAEPEVPRGPLPPGSRYTFTRDSLIWTGGLTLADLLTSIPGVYVARAGFVGQSEYVVYGGRGARALEVYWDGMPMAPVGGDTVYFDAARIYLNNLRRVDVEVLPATLRVYLVSERHETTEDRSLIRIMSGDYASAQYTALFQKRWASGLGLNLGANFLGSNGFSGASRKDHAFDVQARLEWLPTDRNGLVYQIRRQNQDRDQINVSGLTVPPGPTGLVPARHGTRTDALFRAFAYTRPHGEGLGAELLLGSSGWSRDSVLGEQGVHHVGATLRQTGSRESLEITGRLADRRSTRVVSARGGISPLPGVVISADASTEGEVGGRAGTTAHAAVALYRGPFSAVGEVTRDRRVQAPAIRLDTLVTTADALVRGGIDTRALAAHFSMIRRAAYEPLPFDSSTNIDHFAPSTRATYFVSDFKFQPIKPLTLSGWYQNPMKGTADFQPPTLGRVQLTFRSKFWRTFRSGAFDLKLMVAMESWSQGTAGIDASGSSITLPGTSLYEAFISFQIVGFTAFWDLHNAYNSRQAYIPGMVYPRNAQTFGVRWEFFN